MFNKCNKYLCNMLHVLSFNISMNNLRMIGLHDIVNSTGKKKLQSIVYDVEFNVLRQSVSEQRPRNGYYLWLVWWDIAVNQRPGYFGNPAENG